MHNTLDDNSATSKTWLAGWNYVCKSQSREQSL